MNDVAVSRGTAGPIAVRITSISQLFNSLELKELFRMGRRSMVIGMTVLAIGLLVTEFVTSALGESSLGRYFQEGLIILAWVANWKPLEIFLYNWWPVARTRNLYRRLSNADVELRPH